jgi:hypothetical protein
VTCWTEVSCWRKNYSSKASLFLGWHHHTQTLLLSSRSNWPLQNVHFQMAVNFAMLLYTRMANHNITNCDVRITARYVINDEDIFYLFRSFKSNKRHLHPTIHLCHNWHALHWWPSGYGFWLSTKILTQLTHISSVKLSLHIHLYIQVFIGQDGCQM